MRNLNHIYKIARVGKNSYAWIKVLKENKEEKTFTVKGISGNVTDIPTCDAFTERAFTMIERYMLRKYGKVFDKEKMRFVNI